MFKFKRYSYARNIYKNKICCLNYNCKITYDVFALRCEWSIDINSYWILYGRDSHHISLPISNVGAYFVLWDNCKSIFIPILFYTLFLFIPLHCKGIKIHFINVVSISYIAHFILSGSGVKNMWRKLIMHTF